MLIATGLPVGPIIAVNGLNDAFWWHAHSFSMFSMTKAYIR